MNFNSIIKRLFVFFMSIFLIFSNFNIPVYASGAAAAKVIEILGSLGMTFVASGVGTAAASMVDNWMNGGKKYYDSTGENNNLDYYSHNSAISESYGDITNSGANNENCYNSFSSTVTNNRTFSLIKDSYNTTTNNYTTLLYNPITNNYTEVNNIYHNNQYDTYYIENNEYNYYVTNNYTYVSYYIINNETSEESYYEIYYEMPDGRNSYDLEKEDIWGEYFVYDVVGYESVQEDDGKTLALYHLDGDGKDSSYWKNSDISLSSGVFSDAKFGQGINIVTNYNSTVTLSDFNNFTFEFTVVASTPSVCNYIRVNDTVCQINYISSAGIYSYVVQSYNGELSVYCNGRDVLNCTVDYSSDYNTRIFASIYDGGTVEFWALPTTETYSYGTIYARKIPYILDEVRLSNCALYSSDTISVPTQPFDTNQVLVLPSEPTESMIAVQGKYSVSGFRVGGVRPTYPTKGYVYIYLEDDVVADIQQYEGDAWYSVNGAIYKNGSWSDLSGYNMSSLAFEEEDDSGSGDGSGDSDTDSGGGSVSDNDSVSGNGTSGSGVGDLIDGIGKIFDTILSLIGKVIGVFADFAQSILDLFSGFTSFTDGFSNFLAATFVFIPVEVWDIIKVGLSLMVILAIIIFLRK